MIKIYKLKYNFLDLRNYKNPRKYNLDEKTINFINENIDNLLDGEKAAEKKVRNKILK